MEEREGQKMLANVEYFQRLLPLWVGVPGVQFSMQAFAQLENDFIVENLHLAADTRELAPWSVGCSFRTVQLRDIVE